MFIADPSLAKLVHFQVRIFKILKVSQIRAWYMLPSGAKNNSNFTCVDNCCNRPISCIF